MSKYFDAALKSLRTPICEGRGVKVFRLDEAVSGRSKDEAKRLGKAIVSFIQRTIKGPERRARGDYKHGATSQDFSDYYNIHINAPADKQKSILANLEKKGVKKSEIDVKGPTSKRSTISPNVILVTVKLKYNKSLNENEGPKYPDIEVQLTGNDGNAFAILGAVSKAMRRAKVDSKDIDAFMDEATAGDYNHLLQTAMKWVSVG